MRKTSTMLHIRVIEDSAGHRGLPLGHTHVCHAIPPVSWSNESGHFRFACWSHHQIKNICDHSMLNTLNLYIKVNVIAFAVREKLWVCMYGCISPSNPSIEVNTSLLMPFLHVDYPHPLLDVEKKTRTLLYSKPVATSAPLIIHQWFIRER